jgi:hypothetical protein
MIDWNLLQKVMDYKSTIFAIAKNIHDKNKYILYMCVNNYQTWLYHFESIPSH